MHRLKTFSTIIAVSLTLTLLARAFGEESVGTLVVQVTDPNGGQLPSGALTVTSEKGGTVYSGRSVTSATVNVPYGRYTVSFRSELLKPVSRTIDISTPESLIVLSTSIDPENMHLPPAHSALSLRVLPALRCRGPLWAKIDGVFSQYSAAHSVRTSGYALFDDVPVGTYTVAIIDSTTVRALTWIEVRGSVTTKEIDLQPCGK